MRETIMNDIVAAMKAKEKEKLKVLRMLKGAIQLEEIEKKDILTDEEVIAVIIKQIKMRKESLAEFEKASREDLASKTKDELSILEVYMPEQLSEEDIEKELSVIFEKINPVGMKDMGAVMAMANKTLKGKADMTVVSKKVKEKINNL